MAKTEKFQQARPASGWMLAGFLALLALTGPAVAQGGKGKLEVSATIAKHASLKMLSRSPVIIVTQADLERGFVDAPAPAQLAVRSNSPAGYLLVFEGHSDFVRQTRVTGLGNDVQFGPAGGGVPQAAAGRGMGTRTLDLGFRFHLSETARAGTHAWPLQVSVVPL